eukprot:359087-Chlamydomonas_euryale.AAC.2
MIVPPRLKLPDADADGAQGAARRWAAGSVDASGSSPDGALAVGVASPTDDESGAGGPCPSPGGALAQSCDLTMAMLGGLISRPRLTPRRLCRPPFKYLHAIVCAVRRGPRRRAWRERVGRASAVSREGGGGPVRPCGLARGGACTNGGRTGGQRANVWRSIRLLRAGAHGGGGG